MKLKGFITTVLSAVMLTGAVPISVGAEGILTDSDISSFSQLSRESHGYGQGLECDDENRPTGAMMFNDEYSCYDSYAIFNDGKGVCLTFDQGYENGYTESILEQAEEEIMSLHNFVQQEYNYDMTYFRPPCGEYSEQALAVCQKLGYKTMLWSFAYCDWDVNNQPAVNTAFERVSGAAHNGAIYLLHSVSATNAEILPQVIDSIRVQGYEFTLPTV